MKTVIGFFENEVVKRVSDELQAARFTNVQRRTKSKPGTLKELTDAGVPSSEANLYLDELSRGGTLLTLETSDEEAPRAIEIMRRNGARDFRANLARLESDGLIPIVEERIEVGKRSVDLGGVRIHPRIVDTPVEQEVILREEHVSVDRRRVDRPATERDYAEREIAMTERAEQAYATKTAHVVEEIRLDKTVTEHTERVHDTLRHTEVELREIPGSAPAAVAQPALAEGDALRDSIPVVAEELHVGKVGYERGGRVVRSRVVQTPFVQEVALRDEHVNVDSRRVDRPATSADFKAPDLQMNERSERPFTSKTASVIEEIALNKAVEERKEKIRDTVRHTEVDVEDLRAMRGWDLYSKDYRAHFDKTIGAKGGAWEGYEPAYRMGHEYGNGAREWNVIEYEARERWEKVNPGTWARVKDAVRAAFDRTRAAAAPSISRHA